jgi:hypothetical protein
MACLPSALTHPSSCQRGSSCASRLPNPLSFIVPLTQWLKYELAPHSRYRIWGCQRVIDIQSEADPFGLF